MKKILIAMAMMSAMAMAQTSGSTDQSTNPSSSTPQASSTQSSTSPDTSAQSSDTSATHKDHAKTSSDSSALPQSDKDKDKDKASAGKEKSVTGCLHKDGDNFWLKTRATKYHVMSSQDLSAHDGHEVKVTGTASKAPMPGSSDTKKINHLEATNVEMVADQCKMGTKTMKMKGDQLEKEQPKK